MRNLDDLIAISTGLFGGSICFFQVQSEFWMELLLAAITAFICGAGGYLGKQLVIWLTRFFKPNNKSFDEEN